MYYAAEEEVTFEQVHKNKINTKYQPRIRLQILIINPTSILFFIHIYKNKINVKYMTRVHYWINNLCHLIREISMLCSSYFIMHSENV